MPKSKSKTKNKKDDFYRKAGLTDAQIIAKAKKAWGGTKKTAGKVAKGAGQGVDITWDTLKGSAKEVTSGDFGLRMGRHATKAAKAVGREAGDIFRTASEQAKKYIAEAVRLGRLGSESMDDAIPPHIKRGDVPAPNKKAVEERFQEEEEWGISRRINKKKKK